jgi:hypothetical protein
MTYGRKKLSQYFVSKDVEKALSALCKLYGADLCIFLNHFANGREWNSLPGKLGTQRRSYEILATMSSLSIIVEKAIQDMEDSPVSDKKKA